MTRATWLLIAPALLLLGGFLVLPYLDIILMSVRTPSRVGMYGPGFTIGNYTRVLADPFYLGVLWQTLWVGAATTLACALLGTPLACHLARATPRWSGLLYTLVLSPLLVGVIVRSFGWLIILSPNGVINGLLRQLSLIQAPLPLMNNELGVIIGLTHVFLPLMILPVLASVQSIGPTLPLAARSLGSTSWHAFTRVTLPLCRPGLQAGGILVFVLSVSAYATPVMLGGARVRTIPVMVVQQLIDNFQWPFGAALALVLAAAAAALVGLYAALTTPRAESLP